MSIDPSRPVERTVGTGYAEYYTEQYKRSQEAARQQDFARAEAAGEIGLKFDEVKQLLQRLQRDLDAVPSPQTVARVTGASKHAAAEFANELVRTVKQAAIAAQFIDGALSAFAEAVAKTLAEVHDTEFDAGMRIATVEQAVESPQKASKPQWRGA